MIERESWFVYLLECSDQTYYCGIARNTAKRLRQHNGIIAGGSKYTAHRRPVRLIGQLAVATRSQALRIEARIKKMPRMAKLHFFTGKPPCQDWN